MNRSKGQLQYSSSSFAYELLDFGDGRKLENFAGRILDRPCPAARGVRRLRSSDWHFAKHVYCEHPESIWKPPVVQAPVEEAEEAWVFCWQSIKMELRLSPFGHVGLFPEQISNWRWLERLVGSRRADSPLTALNLFGYTGGSTLALTSAGCHTTHVDASRPTVQWAKKNAELSGLASAPIRWIIDDVRDFVKREAKRGHHYDIVLMDPPAYGHGTDGKGWVLERDLPNLIDDCLKLLRPHSAAFLLTGHSPIPSIEQGPLVERSWDRLAAAFSQISKHRVSLSDSTNRKLDFGFAYRLWNPASLKSEAPHPS